MAQKGPGPKSVGFPWPKMSTGLLEAHGSGPDERETNLKLVYEQAIPVWIQNVSFWDLIFWVFGAKCQDQACFFRLKWSFLHRLILLVDVLCIIYCPGLHVTSISTGLCGTTSFYSTIEAWHGGFWRWSRSHQWFPNKKMASLGWPRDELTVWAGRHGAGLFCLLGVRCYEIKT